MDVNEDFYFSSSQSSHSDLSQCTPSDSGVSLSQDSFTTQDDIYIQGELDLESDLEVHTKKMYRYLYLCMYLSFYTLIAIFHKSNICTHINHTNYL